MAMFTVCVVRLLLSYMILLAMEELHMLGQHWQMAQAADPKQLKEMHSIFVSRIQ